MAGMQKWLEGFVFRGRPPWVTDAPAWHVEVGRCVEDDDGTREMLTPLTLTPEQAEAAGFPLSSVLAGIDTAALAGRDAAVAEAATARQERDAAKQAQAAAEAERDALAAQLAAHQPPTEPAAISDRQFFQALADAGSITQAEALAAVMTGTLPARIEAAVEGLPADQQFAARMLLSGATTFERGHPMVAQLGAALGYDTAALDALWSAAAAL